MLSELITYANHSSKNKVICKAIMFMFVNIMPLYINIEQFVNFPFPLFVT